MNKNLKKETQPLLPHGTWQESSVAVPSEGKHTLLAIPGPTPTHKWRLTAWPLTLLSLQPQESTGIIIARTPFLSPQVR